MHIIRIDQFKTEPQKEHLGTPHAILHLEKKTADCGKESILICENGNQQQNPDFRAIQRVVERTDTFLNIAVILVIEKIFYSVKRFIILITTIL